VFAGAVVVDLGCGSKKIPGALGVDKAEGDGIDIVHNLDEFISVISWLCNAQLILNMRQQ